MRVITSNMAAFLGDPNFPAKTAGTRSSRGEKIRLYQDLYMQYSRLAFSRIEDRPIAIAGLEKRLIREFGTNGGFGVFDDGKGLLQRGLLWRRGEKNLERIDFPSDWFMPVPSWSWMAYKGGIDYVDPPFGEIEWEHQEIRSPWSARESKTLHSTASVPLKQTLTVVARDFALGKPEDKSSAIFYDIAGQTDGQNTKCVVVGRHKSGVLASDKLHYVLLIRTKRSKTHEYERVGVGYMPGRMIALSGQGLEVKVD